MILSNVAVSLPRGSDIRAIDARTCCHTRLRKKRPAAWKPFLNSLESRPASAPIAQLVEQMTLNH